MAYPRRPLLLPLALAALVLASGCGGDHKPKANPSLTAAPSTTSPTPSGSASGSTAPNASPSAGTSGRTSVPPGSSSTSPGSPGGTPSHASGSPSGYTINVVLKLAHSCVQPGGTQVADVTTLPGALVVIDTKYSDDKDGQVHGGLKADGRADGTGHFRYTWTVLPGTPPGEATTYVASATKERKGADTKKFNVALTC